MDAPKTFYMRVLPSHCIALSSANGRELFHQALCSGTMEGYFALAAQFTTQSEPAYCGLSSLVVSLNAMGTDPKRTWKGPWRWIDESMLDCCSPLEVVKEKGITMAQFACLARCNGAAVRTMYGERQTLQQLRRDVLRAMCNGDAESVVVVSYDRAGLQQSGSGHFSPIGGYHEEKDLVLIMDVARFKYPPHFVSLEMLFNAMQAHDPSTGKSRGWHVLQRDVRQTSHPHLRFKAHISSPKWKSFLDRALGVPKDELIKVIVEASSEPGFPRLEPVEDEDLRALLEQVHELPVYAQVAEGVSDDGARAIACILYLAIAGDGQEKEPLLTEVEGARRVITTMREFCCGVPAERSMSASDAQQGQLAVADPSTCYGCKTSFAPGERHFCRRCGYPYCNKCSSVSVALPELGYKHVVRLCAPCITDMAHPSKSLSQQQQQPECSSSCTSCRN